MVYSMRVIFMGSPHFVIPPCAELLHHPSHQLCAIVTPPARKAGRARRLQDPPLASWSKSLIQDQISQKLPICLQPESPEDPEFLNTIISLHPDVIITAAYGYILRISFLNIASHGVINIHPSLLPQYRGPTPVPTALMRGEKTTGITIAHTVENIDHGHIIAQQKMQIQEHHTSLSLLTELFTTSSKLLLTALANLQDPNFIPTPQNHSQATFTHKLTKSMGLIDFSLPAAQIIQRYRAFIPWPKSYTYFQSKRVIFEHITSLPENITHPNLKTKEFHYEPLIKALCVGVENSGCFIVTKLTYEGRKTQNAGDFWNSLPRSEHTPYVFHNH